jgi:hypothetical protein
MEKKQYAPNVAFWAKETGNLMSHGKGLTAEQVAFFQSLKEGDRLIIWSNNNNGDESKPTHSLKQYVKREGGSKGF